MNKQDVIEFFEGRHETANAVGVTPQAVSDWPDLLPRRIADRVIAAIVRKGRRVPANFLTTAPDQAA